MTCRPVRVVPGLREPRWRTPSAPPGLGRWMVLLLIVAAPRELAAQPALSPRVVTVQHLVWAAYPELQTANLQAVIHETPAGVTLELAAVPAEDATARRRSAPELRVEATFDASQRLTRLTASGRRVHDAERATLTRDARTVSAAQEDRGGAGVAGAAAPLAAALRRAGARVAPDDPTAVPRLPIAALTPTLGPLTVTRAAFETVDPAMRLLWRVQATAADGAHYELRFEPIEGHLVGLTRLGGVQ